MPTQIPPSPVIPIRKQPDPTPEELAEEAMRSSERIEARRKKHAPDAPRIYTWPDVSAGRYIEPPPPMEYLFDDLVIRGVVGMLHAAGGTGKSFMALQMGMALATGRRFGPFTPARKFKVLYLGGEDPDDILHRRVHAIAEHWGILNSPDLTGNMGLLSVVGRTTPLMKLDSAGNAIQNDGLTLLKDLLDMLAGVEVLILDPLSRFYGLPENQNEAATAFISTLEKLSQAAGLNIFVVHHEAKAMAQNKEARDSTGRGASAFRDGVRWAATLRGLTEKDRTKYGLEVHDHVEFDVTKSNHSPTLPSSKFFRRTEAGVLEHITPRTERLDKGANILAQLLRDDGGEFTHRDLCSQPEGKKIADRLGNELPGDGKAKFTRGRDMPLMIDRGLEAGVLEEVIEGRKRVIRPVAWDAE